MTTREQIGTEYTAQVSALSGEGLQPAEAHEPLADARIRPLLERYVAAAGAQLIALGDDLFELIVPPNDRPAFRRRERVRIAFTIDALERDPDAEIAVVGSPLAEQLVAAIRSRGSRISHGLVAPELAPEAHAAELRIPITNGSASVPEVDVARHAVVQLLARVVVRAGSAVEEHLVESGCFDAVTGAVVPEDVVARCREVACSMAPASAAPGDTVTTLEPSQPSDALVSLALGNLRTTLAPRLLRLRDEAQRALVAELQRIDGYYTSLLEGSGGRGSDVPDAASRHAFASEHARRRAEEERRHQVRVVVHPVQLIEWELLVQRGRWEITARTGARAPLVAERWLNGTGAWTLACPTCGAGSPRSLAVCTSGHVACETCARCCGVCGAEFCWDHGIAACHVDGRPTCQEHARSCSSCGEPYCTSHEATCSDGEHPACADCVNACAVCARQVCNAHATQTTAAAPRGARRLCGECVRLCEGGTNEPVGRDEVTRCSSCEKCVCEQHRSTCAVDGRVHCSRHLRRTDGSRRLVCDEHRTACALEPAAILAVDEVAPCATCGRSACEHHRHPCVEDGRWYCAEHVTALRGRPGAYACAAHHRVCHVDQAAYGLGETKECPVCTRAACRQHLRNCSWCGRAVCVSDLDAGQGRCTTCTRLATTEDPDDAIVTAGSALVGDGQRPRSWKTARDASDTIVELDLAWRRRVVFAVRHGDTAASGGRSHSMVGSRPLGRTGRRASA